MGHCGGCNCKSEKYYSDWMGRHVMTTLAFVNIASDVRDMFCGTVIDVSDKVMEVRRCDTGEKISLNASWLELAPRKPWHKRFTKKLHHCQHSSSCCC